MTSLADPLPLHHGPTWRNRLIMAPLTNKQSHPDGSLSQDEHRWLEARGEGGFAHVPTAAAYVAPAGKAWVGQLGVHCDAMLPGLERLAAAIRSTGATSAVQLHHGGMRADSAVNGTGLVAPWDDPERGVRALTTSEVRQCVADFVAAAVRAERAGFDGVQVHGAHGYLVCQFLDARRNHREDGYGGDLAGRSRFLRDVVEGVRAATGPDFQVGLRLSPERFGMAVAESREVTAWALGSGLLDAVDISLWDAFKEPAEGVAPGEPGLLIDHFTGLERGSTRLTVAGKVLDAAGARWCLDHGADAVVIGTGAILQHDFANRVLADPDFGSIGQPVTREHLAAEWVGPAFIDYLATGWKDFVC